jgi:hypothetical protein
MYHGIYYGTRRLPQGYGIVVATYRAGAWIETDLNTTPWPSSDVALNRAHGSAVALRDNFAPDLPIVRGIPQ